ncbi:lipopolysaccharide transport periplasmic protein LptA [Marinomonas piezotolerans]|uniref:Lipopolysaccharide export system protein LptA n=1 Tax=Marinomonas piezotolerans TaxID=2213058 RepID=A0A370UDB5_9GAMM|nr:lipopolysaccharide transport periplasmic protein LptA [Marinomonas piezotolerans]RDL45774.1 lipopolysaccharide transport periplasmic protein LptA [Marinomonas piezotolerans]
MNPLKTKTLFFACSALFCLEAFALPDDQQQPISIEADKAFFDQKTGVATYDGNVIAKQGSIEIIAEHLTIKTDIATNEFNSLHAKGSPSSFSQTIDEAGSILKATGDTLDYSVTKGELEVHDNGFLKRGDNEISADYIHYFIEKDTFNAENRGSGRVNMTLQPASNQQN